MSSTFPLGRVAGIEIRAHWSWLLVVALLVWSLADGVFPATNRGLPAGAYLAMAVAAALLFFVSLTLHELGHALQARREGVELDDIVLWVFGGVARMKGTIPSAGAELRIAIAGPAVSLAIGAACVALALLAPLPSGVDGVVFWVGQINLTLLLFNLLPALPLDGGRVFRALLWMRRRDFMAATRTAGRVGRAFGQLMIGGGLALAILWGDFGGLWLSFLGWFLLSAAEAELQAAEARGALSGLRVADLAVHDPVTVPPHMSVQDFLEHAFFPNRHTAYPVVGGDGSALGLVSYRQALAVPREEWLTTSMRAIMTPADQACVDPEAPLAEVFPLLAGSPQRRMLVCRDGRLEGLLSFTDVARVHEVRTAAPGAAAHREPVPA